MLPCRSLSLRSARSSLRPGQRGGSEDVIREGTFREVLVDVVDALEVVELGLDGGDELFVGELTLKVC